MRGRILGQGHGLPAEEDFLEVIEIISCYHNREYVRKIMSAQLERIMPAQFKQKKHKKDKRY